MARKLLTTDRSASMREKRSNPAFALAHKLSQRTRHLTPAQREDYHDLRKRGGYSVTDAFRLLGRADLVEGVK